MNINNLAYFKALTTKLNWLDQRQRVIASNVANADTPNYKPKDLKPITFKGALEADQAGSRTSNLGMAKTNAQHLTGGSVSGGEGAKSFATNKPKYESSPVGNSVILEEEMIKVTDTASNYKIMLRLYKKGADMMKLAVRPPK